ncbi:sulfurtransferase [Rhodococcus sp. NPDC058521]|uniref:sulfurtransferase n=1 Tax=Rhodococcus sp. NPDC058521 TaxID=3346536 RepID=UPI00364A97BB
MSSERLALLVSAVRLRDDPPEKLVILDVGIGSARARFALRHLPSARYVDVDTDLAGQASAESGTRPLPASNDLTAALRSWGIDSDSTVVVYDDAGTAPAARAWWVLKWAGLADVRILDGGLQAWDASGGRLVSTIAPVTAGTVTACPGGLPVAHTADVAGLPAHGVLLDARSHGLYRGEDEQGHIPGALAAPVADDFDENGLLRDEATLRARYRHLGLTDSVPAATYCGSAVAAALQVFVLATLSIEVALYPGSLSQWTADPARPLVRGDAAPKPVTTS